MGKAAKKHAKSEVAVAIREAVEVRMEVERAKFANQPTKAEAAGAIAPLSTWKGKRVRHLQTWSEGKVIAVTDNGKLRVKFDEDDEGSRPKLMQPKKVELLEYQ